MEIDETIKSAWEEWELVEHLGSGRYGRVYRAKNKSRLVEMQSAIKIIEIPSEDDQARMKKLSEAEKRRQIEELKNECVCEIEIMIQLGESPNVIHIEDYKVVETGDGGYHIHIRMDLLANLDAYIDEKTENGRFPEAEIIRLGMDICSALELCAAQRPPIIHRDIKYENILATKSGTYKLGDFGVARRLNSSNGEYSIAGTGHYMAPEVCSSRPYGATADIYSLGIVLYVLANGKRLPFIDAQSKTAPLKRENEEACIRRLQGEPLPPPTNASDRLSRVILKACAYEPAERYKTASEFKAALARAGEDGIAKQKRGHRAKRAGRFFLFCVYMLWSAIVVMFASSNSISKSVGDEVFATATDLKTNGVAEITTETTAEPTTEEPTTEEPTTEEPTTEEPTTEEPTTEEITTEKPTESPNSTITIGGDEYSIDLREMNLHNKKIEDIGELKYFTNLTELILSYNQISDISALKGLIDLTVLNVEFNQINDISILRGLTNLTVLNVRFNQIGNIGVLRSLTNLTSLNLWSNKIIDIKPLSNLINLTELDLGSNQIGDIGALEKLTNLHELNLEYNQINDISILKNLTNLTDLNIANNQISAEQINELQNALPNCNITH